jgi:hypothetical protein
MTLWLLAAPLAAADPMPGLVRSRDALRRLDCERLSAWDAADRYPGRVPRPEGREVDPDRTYVVCADRLFAPGFRDPGAEAALWAMSDTAASAAAAARATGLARTWHVEVFHASSPVAAKLGFAVKAALVAEGLAVSDRAPRLGPDDLDVLLRLEPLRAYPAACARWAATGGLSGEDALLGVVQLDRRATALQVGVCADGGWTWLR